MINSKTSHTGNQVFKFLPILCVNYFFNFVILFIENENVWFVSSDDHRKNSTMEGKIHALQDCMGMAK